MAEEQPPQTPQKPPPKTNQTSSHYDFQISLEYSISYSPFSLEKAVCSHGLFCMAPNKWDPQTKSLFRPLRLSPSSSSSAMVRISQLPGSLLVRVYGRAVLMAEEREAVEGQVRRMLRLSEREERKVREFQELHGKAREEGFGRVFRSPTLFEDMVKAILFCNCQWPRTLSMANALCDLQLELQCRSSKEYVNALGDRKIEVFTPATPAVKESRRKRKIQTVSREDESEGHHVVRLKSAQTVNEFELENIVTNSMSSNSDVSLDELTTGCLAHDSGSSVSTAERVGNFPSPEEIASLDEKYLAKSCGLGYRAGRILKLAQGVVDGRVQISELEELCTETSILSYTKVEDKLKEIYGYGPFTRGNVLMCMGFYNVVPTDSESIRHLNQVHARKTTVQTVQKVVDEMYRKYEPYQFLAYWWELWHFYEGWFGKFSEMPSSQYRLITAKNMKIKKGRTKNIMT